MKEHTRNDSNKPYLTMLKCADIKFYFVLSFFVEYIINLGVSHVLYEIICDSKNPDKCVNWYK